MQKRKIFKIMKIMQGIEGAWFSAIYVVFLQAHGLSLFQATQVNMAFMLIISLFDPYTGALADKFGQKRVYLLGSFISSIGFFIYGLSSSFWFFVLAESIIGVAYALRSEALESWFRNNNDDINVVNKTLAQSSTYARIGSIPVALLGGFIAAFIGYQYIWYLSALTAIVGFVIGFRFIEDDDYRYVHPNGVHGSMKEALLLVFKVSDLKKIVIISSMFALLTQPFNMFWSPIIKDAGGEIWWLGFIWVGVSVFSAIGSYIASKFNPDRFSIAKILIVVGMPMLLPVFFPKALWITVFFLMHEIGRGGIIPLVFSWSNKHIPNHIRSTTNSIRSSIGTLGRAIGLLGFGYMSDHVSALTTWFIAGIMLVVLSGYALIPTKHIHD